MLDVRHEVLDSLDIMYHFFCMLVETRILLSSGDCYTVYYILYSEVLGHTRAYSGDSGILGRLERARAYCRPWMV